MWLRQQCGAQFQLKKGVDVMQSLMKGKDFFKAQYIYIWKQINVQRKLNFSTLCLHVKESCKVCEESNKACEESDKALWKYLTASLLEKDFFWKKIFFALLKILY